MRLVKVKFKDSSLPTNHYIYYNYDEFREYNPDATLITKNDLLVYGLDKANNNLSFIKKNIWVKTDDKFVPDYRVGRQIVFKTDENGNKIPIDGCYMQIFLIKTNKRIIQLRCCNGFQYIYYPNGYLTAAILPTKYEKEYLVKNNDVPLKYRSSKTFINEVRWIWAVFNSDSEYYMQPYKAIKKYLYFNKAIAEKYLALNTTKMKIIKELKNMNGLISNALKTKFTPEFLVAQLEEAFKIATEEKNTKEIREMIKMVVDMAYKDDTIQYSHSTEIAEVDSLPFELNDYKGLSEEEQKKILGAVKDELDIPDYINEAI